MGKPYPIFGAGTPEERREVEHVINEARAEHRQRKDGEVEKTAEHLRTIEIANQIIRSVFDKLGLEAFPITPDQVHLFDEKTFAKLSGKPSWELAGFARMFDDAMYILLDSAIGDFDFVEFNSHIVQQIKEKKESLVDTIAWQEIALERTGFSEIPEEGTEDFRVWDEAAEEFLDEEDQKIDKWGEEQLVRFGQFEKRALLQTLVHESLHLLSYQRFHLRHESEEQTLVDLPRTGYYTLTKAGQARFASLNEAVTEQITQDAMAEHGELLKSEGYSVENFKDVSDNEFSDEVAKLARNREAQTYPDDRELLRHILEKIAEKNNETVASVWEKFVRGYLDGTMAYLGDIERTFGRGALKFYAGLFPDDLSDWMQRELVWKYFDTDSDGAREAISREFEAARIRAYKRGETAAEYQPTTNFDYWDEFDDDYDDYDEYEDEEE